ncbi:ATP-grasp domain-containing protein [Geitlerinema sp. CS-897]|nr:ATP-grasp domain-containing protein [Geitlerinema sp. CS-897]
MPTLVLSSRYSEDSIALWRAAIARGWDVERLVNWRLPPRLKTVSEPVLHLEGLMADAIAEQLGVRLLTPAIDWLPNLPERYRKRWVYLSTLGEFRKSKTEAFVKPPNDKSFPARVYKIANLPSDYPDEMPILISEIVQWEKEFRCFILNRNIKTFSIYLRHGKLQSENQFIHTHKEACELRQFMEILLSEDRVRIPQATVIDVGTIRGRGWAVVEQNSAWGAGLYGCDRDRVLEVLKYATVTI